MNTDTGKIYSPEEMKALDESLKGIPMQSDFRLSDYTAKEMTKAKQDGKLLEMKVAPTDDQLKRGKVGRNEMCPCGSGIKFKRCHWTGRYGQ